MCTHDVESQAYCAAEHQRIDAFDFDGLPPRPLRHHQSDSTAASLPSPTTPTFTSSPVLPHASPVDPEKLQRGVHFASDVEKQARATRPLGQREVPRGPMGKFVGMLQQKCGPRNVAMYLLGSGVHDSASTLDAPESTVVGIGDGPAPAIPTAKPTATVRLMTIPGPDGPQMSITNTQNESRLSRDRLPTLRDGSRSRTAPRRPDAFPNSAPGVRRTQSPRLPLAPSSFPFWLRPYLFFYSFCCTSCASYLISTIHTRPVATSRAVLAYPIR